MKLTKSVVIVGPDRCWKTTLARHLSLHVAPIVPVPARTDLATFAAALRGAPRVYDRGVICSRVYDRVHRRNISDQQDADACAAEAAMRETGAVYVFLDRSDWAHVADEKDLMDGVRLRYASQLYAKMLPDTGAPFRRFGVDDSTGSDTAAWTALFGDVTAFLRETGAAT